MPELAFDILESHSLHSACSDIRRCSAAAFIANHKAGDLGRSEVRSQCSI